MVEVPQEIKNTINQYIFLLRENNIPIQKLYLFGSYAKGNYTEYSDIDLAISSEIFDGIRILDKKKIRPLTLSISSKIEVIPFNPEDFNQDNPFAKEIIETGIRII